MSLLIKHTWNRINTHNKNWLAVICGDTGSGKSYCAMRIAEKLDESFDVSRVVFSVKEFMELLNAGTLKKGNMIIFDEAGVGVASREWYTARNKSVNYVLQTFRHLNLGVIFTTPDFNFVDKQTRKLFHSYIKTLKIDKKRKAVRVKWFQLQNNPRYSQLYYKYPRVKGSTFKMISSVYIKKPSKELVKAYEKKKESFSQKLRDDIYEDMNKVEVEEKKKSIKEIIEEVKKNHEEFVDEYNQRKFISVPLIRAEYELSKAKAKIVKTKVEQEITLT